MTQLWDFSGGIHPPEHKELSTARPIRNAGLPGYLILPLQQHIGDPAEAVVEVGERVLKGQQIADVKTGMGVPVHAPTSGVIESIADYPVPHPSGMADRCITLKPDGEDQWCQRNPVKDYRSLERDQVLQIIRDAGISGMGGAGFPTNIKLRPPRDRKVSTLILNGAECEPYITADDMTMREKADEVVAGLKIMAWILRPERCVIGIEDNKPEAIAALRKATEGTQTEIAVVPTKYPSGGEKQLIQILTGMEVPSGGIPADIGVMCQNIGTAVAVAQAVFEGTPLISRVVTITGEAVREPGNFEALIGTPIEHLLKQAGVNQDAVSRLVLGGPMMGYTLTTEAVPVIKTTNCVIAATAAELPTPPPEQPCIRCGQCAEVCPMELLPQQLFWHAKATEFEKAEHLNLFDCIECGACSYVCPSSIPLVQYYRFAKGEIRAQQAEQLKSDRARERFEARQARLEREQQEKELRRKERAKAAAEAAAKKQAEAEKAAVEGEAVDERAAKSALVEQALARKKAKAEASQPPAASAPPAPSAPPAEQKPDIEALEKQLSQAQSKLDTMQGMLDDAKAQQADNVEKLERAVAKNHDRVQRAEDALSEAREKLAAGSTESQPTH
ncbi:electron transport complex subunit RsxC [Marinobacter sp. EhC06]|jgi:electron transport complex protein RnfC|uniref:electron transport complex subunit RsxC n=1 Tax=Marinobacter TaxID=2742 RepID=UPI0007D9E70B|nr:MULTISPECIES: electron transport complex subunit RsxC [unclassified Marinobacter]OAN86772.1 electron transport complex subunit RsxC [Marinobacter sp. EhN04]OAN89316.1 electron transport complex subunit RsxC [Marinobacter sp. EhC06]